MSLRNLSLLMILPLSIALAIGCKKENSNGSTHLKIRMTDNPFNASEVNVDIRQVRVHFSDDSTGGWMDLDTHAGVYNLLGLQNGIDTLLAQGTVPAGVLKEIRFVLGDENDITIDNINYPLTIPSGGESGLKIKVNKQLNAGVDSLLIDFDAALSILQTGTGEYKLKPVLKIK
jgi:hypothetical protein